jgi:RNA polymerase sigma-70 factor (ECF subfamily)
VETIVDPALQDDLALVSQAAAGDVQAFDALMRRYNQRLYRTARSILKDEAEAEDAVQEAWWKVWNHLRDFRAEARPSTWLTRITVNEALMRLRRNKSREAVIQSVQTNVPEPDTMTNSEPTAALPDTSQPDQLAWRAELRRRIEVHIDELPDLYRAVFMLRGVEELSSAEVAAVLDLPEATVRVRYMRARRLLQEALKEELDMQARDAFSFAGERCDRIVAGVHARIRAAARAGS